VRNLNIRQSTQEFQLDWESDMAAWLGAEPTPDQLLDAPNRLAQGQIAFKSAANLYPPHATRWRATLRALVLYVAEGVTPFFIPL
jgi:hypothetical protein